MQEPVVTGPLSASSRERLFRLVTRDGELQALRLTGISRSGLMRALSGLPIYGATRRAIELSLAALPTAP